MERQEETVGKPGKFNSDRGAWSEGVSAAKKTDSQPSWKSQPLLFRSHKISSHIERSPNGQTYRPLDRQTDF